MEDANPTMHAIPHYEPERRVPVRDEELREFAHLVPKLKKGKIELRVIRETGGRLAFIEISTSLPIRT